MSDSIDKTELIAQYSQHPLDSKYMLLIAHDVRNQMNTIMMANDMLREELEDSDGDPQKYIGMISHASKEILVILEAAVTAHAGHRDTKTPKEP